MGTPKEPSKVNFFVGLLSPKIEIPMVESVMECQWGPISHRSQPYPFNYSEYYEDELGPHLLRQFFVFKKIVDPLEIRELKLESNQIECDASKEGKRIWNIDPGYIDLDKIVLATTKPATYRIYIGKGIYAQSTLYYQDKSFRSWPWTYRDYKEEIAINFFNEIRNRFKTRYHDELKKT